MASRFSRHRKGGEGKPQFTGQKPSMILYLGVGFIAVLKDLLDLVLLGSLPGIGTVVTFCFTFLIWMLLTLFDRSGGKQNLQMIRGLILAFFGLFEMVAFGFNFLPLQTITVIVLYSLARRAWKKEMKAHNQSNQGQNRREMLNDARLRRREMEEERMALEESSQVAVPPQANRQPANDPQYKKPRKIA